MLYGDAIAEIVTGLKNAGINATTETANLQLPGALVVPGVMAFDRLDGEDYSAEVSIYLLTSNKGSIQSLNDLQALLAKCRQVFPIPEAEPISLALPNVSGPDGSPGLLINLQIEITEE